MIENTFTTTKFRIFNHKLKILEYLSFFFSSLAKWKTIKDDSQFLSTFQSSQKVKELRKNPVKPKSKKINYNKNRYIFVIRKQLDPVNSSFYHESKCILKKGLNKLRPFPEGCKSPALLISRSRFPYFCLTWFAAWIMWFSFVTST